MSLLEAFTDECIIMNKIQVNDGYGGFSTNWIEGATINCAIVENKTLEAEKAKIMGVTSVYTVTTTRDIHLSYHDVIKRKTDGKLLRITSDGDDKYTPSIASLDMRQVTAEEWILPNE